MARDNNPTTTSYYDDDEENPPIGFEQDPDEDEIGVGTWKYADGSTKYSKGDTGDAKRLMKAAPPAPEDQKGLGSQGPYAPPAPAAALTPEERAPLEMSPEERSALGGDVPEAAAPAAPTPEASEQPKPLQALTAPRMPGAAGPARYTDSAGSSASQSTSQSDQQSVQHTGSAQDRGEFDRGQQSIAGAYDQASEATRQGTQGVTQAIDQRARAMAQMGADKEAATAGAMAAQQARAEQVKRKIVEVGARPTDHNKIWKDKGVLGTTLGLLGVALRSLTATKFGGPNTAMQSLQEQRKQNLQAQMEDRDSELRGLERELGSLDAAVPIFEARMRDAENKRIEGLLADEKSATMLANGQQMIAQNNQEKTKLLADGAKAYAGTIAKQQSQASQLSQQQGVEQSRQRLSGAGVGDGGPQGKTREQVYADLLEIDKKEEERGVPKEDRAKKWESYGFKAPAGESAPETTNREQREKIQRDEAAFSEDQAKAENAMQGIGSFGDAAGLTRDPKTGKWQEPGIISGTVKPGWSEPIGETVGQSTPVRDARVIAQEAVGRLQSGGMIGKEEGETFSSFFGSGEATRNQLASKLNQLETLVESRRKARLRDAPKGPKGRPIPTGGAEP